MRIRCGAAKESFAEWIGRMSYDPTLSGDIKLPDTVQLLRTIESFRETLFPSAEFLQAHSDTEFFRSRCILALRNDICAEWNIRVVDNLQGDLNTLDSADRILDETAASHRSDFLPLNFFER